MRSVGEIYNEVKKRMVGDIEGKTIKKFYHNREVLSNEFNFFLFTDGTFCINEGFWTLPYMSDFLQKRIYEGLFQAGVISESDFLLIQSQLKLEEEEKAKEKRKNDIEWHERELEKLKK